MTSEPAESRPITESRRSNKLWANKGDRRIAPPGWASALAVGGWWGGGALGGAWGGKGSWLANILGKGYREDLNRVRYGGNQSGLREQTSCGNAEKGQVNMTPHAHDPFPTNLQSQK